MNKNKTEIVSWCNNAWTCWKFKQLLGFFAVGSLMTLRIVACCKKKRNSTTIGRRLPPAKHQMSLSLRGTAHAQ